MVHLPTKRETDVNKRKCVDILMFKFLVQTGFSASVLALCIFMLATGRAEDEKSRTLYWSGLTSTLAHWLPAPNFEPDNTRQTKSQRKLDKS